MKKKLLIIGGVSLFLIICVIVLFVCIGNKNNTGSNENNENNTVEGENIIFKNAKEIVDDKLGKSYYIEVANSIDKISFSEYIETKGKYIWTISTDIEGNQKISSKVSGINCGENVFYVQVINEKTNDVTQYNLIVKRRNMFTVTYISDGKEIYTDLVEESKKIVPIEEKPEKDGYKFDGWDYDFNETVMSNVEIVAIFSLVEYTISYDLNGGISDIENPTSYTYEESFILNKPSKNDCYFMGWYKDSEFTDEIETIELNSKGNLELFAKFVPKKEILNLDDEKFMYFGLYPQSLVINDAIKEKLELLVGELPNSSSDKDWENYKYYDGVGYYDIPTMLNYMWYKDIELGNYKYRAVYFTDYRPDYTSGGTNSSQKNNGYRTSTVYYFRYDPVLWRVLETDINNNKAFLVANLALDAQAFFYDEDKEREVNGETVYSSNYEYSSIREWLNNNFYNTVFTYEEQNQILESVVENDEIDGYGSNDTIDKIFLLSETEVNDSKYGFTDTTYAVNYDSKKQLKSTDYAKIQGCFSSNNEEDYGNCSWMLRTVYKKIVRDYYGITSVKLGVKGCTSNGQVYYGDIHKINAGIVPALWISL